MKGGAGVRLIGNTRGTALVEYAVLGGLVVLVIVTGVAFLGGRVGDMWGTLANRVSNIWTW